MSRLITLITLAVLSCLTMAAGDTLEIDALFDGRFRADPRVTETIITGNSLAEYNLSTYRSLTLKGTPELTTDIEKAVIRDGARATDREVSFKNGQLHYGFYALPPRNNLRRYIFYLNRQPSQPNQSGKVILIYVDGKADINQIKRMLKK